MYNFPIEGAFESVRRPFEAAAFPPSSGLASIPGIKDFLSAQTFAGCSELLSMQLTREDRDEKPLIEWDAYDASDVTLNFWMGLFVKLSTAS